MFSIECVLYRMCSLTYGTRHGAWSPCFFSLRLIAWSWASITATRCIIGRECERVRGRGRAGGRERVGERRVGRQGREGGREGGSEGGEERERGREGGRNGEGEMYECTHARAHARTLTCTHARARAHTYTQVTFAGDSTQQLPKPPALPSPLPTSRSSSLKCVISLHSSCPSARALALAYTLS